jgi:hypothetical protein
MTLFSVGYGDLVPHTVAGKFLAFVTALWGAFLIAINVVTIGNIFQLNDSQNKAHKHIMLTRSAAKVISLSFKFYLLKKKYYIQLLKRDLKAVEKSPYLAIIADQEDRRVNVKDYKPIPTMFTILRKHQKKVHENSMEN